MPTTPSTTAVLLGITNRVLASRDATDGSLSVVEVTVGPGVGAPPHTNQREAQTWYVLEGELTFFERTTPVTRRAGELIFVPADEVHTFLNQTDRDARALLICTPGGFEGFLVDMAALLPDEAPDGPPPAEDVAAMARVGARYGVIFHVDQ